ncbi:MAG: sulfite exporter TauE/SafE family protein [Candidatus Marinimicrobia bacterium]|nr:sulfite exporter TauE/SafE family protein [Candidatus Neomarinimicrobiota bacterium]
MIVILFIISIFSGFLSGLLGFGGAIVMIPLLLTFPPLLGAGELSMKAIAGLSMVQVFFASLSGMLIHRKNNFVHVPTLLYIGIPMGISAFAGSYLSLYMENRFVLILFTVLVIVSFILLFTDKSDHDAKEMEDIRTQKALCIILGTATGLLSGIAGVGGAIILIPVMIRVLKIPTKITIGTSLAIVFFGAFFGSLGKILSFQVEFLLVLPVVLGSLIAAQFGAMLSKVTPPKVLKYLLIAVLFASIVQAFMKILQ